MVLYGLAGDESCQSVAARSQCEYEARGDWQFLLILAQVKAERGTVMAAEWRKASRSIPSLWTVGLVVGECRT